MAKSHKKKAPKAAKKSAARKPAKKRKACREEARGRAQKTFACCKKTGRECNNTRQRRTTRSRYNSTMDLIGTNNRHAKSSIRSRAVRKKNFCNCATRWSIPWRVSRRILCARAPKAAKLPLSACTRRMRAATPTIAILRSAFCRRNRTRFTKSTRR